MAPTTTTATTPGATTPSASGRPSVAAAAQQRWSEEKPNSLTSSAAMEEHGRKARSASAVALIPSAPGSAPTTRRRGTSASVQLDGSEMKNSFPAIQQQGPSSRGYGHSVEDVRLSVNGPPGRKTSASASISASESSPEDALDQRGGAGASRRGPNRTGKLLILFCFVLFISHALNFCFEEFYAKRKEKNLRCTAALITGCLK